MGKSATLRLKMCKDAYSRTATDGGGSKLREFCGEQNSKIKNVHGRTFPNRLRMAVVPNLESFAVSKTLRLKMCMDAYSPTASGRRWFQISRVLPSSKTLR